MRRKNAIEISSIFRHVKLQSNFIEITLLELVFSRKFAAHFQKPFPKNTSDGLLLSKKMYKTRGSKACKTPLNFLTVKLLWHIQVLWKH